MNHQFLSCLNATFVCKYKWWEQGIWEDIKEASFLFCLALKMKVSFRWERLSSTDAQNIKRQQNFKNTYYFNQKLLCKNSGRKTPFIAGWVERNYYTRKSVISTGTPEFWLVQGEISEDTFYKKVSSEGLSVEMKLGISKSLIKYCSSQ